MTHRATTVTAWSLWLLSLVVVAVLVLSDSGSDGTPVSTVAGVVFILAFATTGALVAARNPRNPIGWLLCNAALAFVVGGVCEQVSQRAARGQQEGVVVTAAAWVGTYVWMLGVGPAATYVLLLFPDGRLPSRRWRVVGWLAGIALGAVTVAIAFAPGPIEASTASNPIGIPGWRGPLQTLESIGLALLFVCILASCASLVARYRAAGREQRLQLKWLAWSLPVVLAWLGASIWVESRLIGETASDVANAFSSIGLTIVPVTIAVAILRHRLYDIDLVIKRTLVYGALTAILLASYLAMVLLLQVGLSPVTSSSDLAVAASTLAVAAMFRPLRARIQAGVDQRFFRSRYNAARTLESFTARLRQEVDLEAVSGDLRGVVRETVQPAHVSLWLRSAP